MWSSGDGRQTWVRISLRNCNGTSALLNRLARAPGHLPEVRLEPGGFLEDRNQLRLAGRRGVEIGEMLHMRPRFGSDLLVRRAGVLGDPDAISVRRRVREGERG